MVDDAEVDELESSDSEIDNQLYDSYEEGEIVETFPNGRGGVGRMPANRFASVSEDEEEHYNSARANTRGQDQSPVESRYAIAKPQSSWKPPIQQPTDQSDSDESIIAIDTPPPEAKKARRVPRAERAAFWQAKAQNQVVEVSDSDE